MKRSLISLFGLFVFLNLLNSQTPFPENGELYKDNVLPVIDIIIHSDSLKEILDAKNILSDREYKAKFIYNNGTVNDTIEDIGFRLRGNTSRYSQKKSFKVSFNTFEKGRKYYGVEKLNLNGEHNDPSIVRTKLCVDLAKQMGIVASRANHVKLYINGAYFGLYINVEHVDEEFVENRFGNNTGNLYKCTYPSDLNYKGSNPDVYKFESSGTRVYELKTNEEEDDYTDLADLIYMLNYTSITDLPCELEKIFNVEEYIKIMAFDVLTGNWDGYAYNKNNFYLYHNAATGKFEYILYDLDNTFGIDWFNEDWTSRNIYTWEKSNEKRPLFTNIMNIPKYRSLFTYYMKKFTDSVFVPEKLNDYLSIKRNMISIAAATDNYRTLDYGFTYSDFYNSYDKNIDYNHVKFGIKDYISRRYFYSLSQIKNNYLLPFISDYKVEVSQDQKINFTAQIGNAILMKEAKVYYDKQKDGTYDFIILRDDGLNGDIYANDKVFSTENIDLNSVPEGFNYYFTIEDNNGLHHTFPSCIPQLYEYNYDRILLSINEFMADNDNFIQDNEGDYDDWIEIYNYGSDSIFLGDKYMTDNPTQPTKWKMPDKWIGPNKFLLFWADEDIEDGQLHCDFKLSAGGEYIGIYSSDTSLIDEYYFGDQQTDQSEGRIPDGTGVFIKVSPTPGYENKPLGIEDKANLVDVRIYPNPVFGELNIDMSSIGSNERAKIMIVNLTGQIVFEGEIINENHYKVITSDFKPGCYIMSIINSQINIQKKFLVLR